MVEYAYIMNTGSLEPETVFTMPILHQLNVIPYIFLQLVILSHTI